jgi:hypothetical protein
VRGWSGYVASGALASGNEVTWGLDNDLANSGSPRLGHEP